MGLFKAMKMKSGYQSLDIGMSKDDVIQLLGKPDGRRVINGVETWSWSNSEWKGTMRGGSIERKMIVDFKDGKVIGWDGNNMSRTIW